MRQENDENMAQHFEAQLTLLINNVERGLRIFPLCLNNSCHKYFLNL
jgi:hypothetical protein